MINRPYLKKILESDDFTKMMDAETGNIRNMPKGPDVATVNGVGMSENELIQMAQDFGVETEGHDFSDIAAAIENAIITAERNDDIKEQTEGIKGPDSGIIISQVNEYLKSKEMTLNDIPSEEARWLAGLIEGETGTPDFDIKYDTDIISVGDGPDATDMDIYWVYCFFVIPEGLDKAELKKAMVHFKDYLIQYKNDAEELVMEEFPNAEEDEPDNFDGLSFRYISEIEGLL